jgi:hypothetical protein
MMTNVFIGTSHAPTPRELTAALGASKKLWDNLLAELTVACEIDSQEWNSCSPKAGWSLRLKHKGRIIVYLSPGQAEFLASFALGDKAIAAAKQSRLPALVMKLIDNAKRYAEGTAVRIEVRTAQDVATVKALAIAKVKR